MERWIALAEAAARDPGLAGAKAAGLARAGAAGLPVLPGAVLPAGASRAAVVAGAEALRAAGPAAAYLAATSAGGDARIDPPRAAGTGPWAVRSSTPFDDDGRWSGAFASYLDVGASDLAVAVRGCWASACARDAVARAEAIGVDVASLRVGVLIQPYVRFQAGGMARVGPDGTVVVSAAPGGPAGVVSRGEGAGSVVDPDGRIADEPQPGVGRADVQAAAALARATAAATGVRSIEWGAVAGRATLLQLGPPEAVRAPQPAPSSRPMPREAERVARLAAAFPGPLGLELVLPWALGADRVPEPIDVGTPTGSDVLAAARSEAGRLASIAWDAEPSEAVARTERLARLLWEGRLDEALGIVARLTPPDATGAGRVLGAIVRIASRLVAAGRLPAEPLVWRLTVEEVERALRGAAAPVRRGPDRWEPFVADVVRAGGARANGAPVHGGIGAGAVNVVDALAGAFRPAPRSVLVARRPLPQLAPLLWHSAGLVVRRGSVGAHLFEVARSLGTPAVTDVDLGELRPGTLVAVDGDRGVVSTLAAPTTPPDARLVGSTSGAG